MKLTDNAARTFEDLGCRVELVENVFDSRPGRSLDGGILRGCRHSVCDRSWKISVILLDPAVAEVLEPALSQDMRDYYTKVFARYALRDKIRTFFEKYDLLISPVLPVTSLDVGKNIPDALSDRNLVSWVYYTYPFNLTGQPAASVCAGIAPDGMPVGLQIVGRSHCEDDVVRAAAAFERSQPAGYNVKTFEF